MSKSRLGDFAHDDRGGNAVAAAVLRNSVRDTRPWLRWKIDDREAAAWLQRSQQAGTNVFRLCQMVVHNWGTSRVACSSSARTRAAVSCAANAAGTVKRRHATYAKRYRLDMNLLLRTANTSFDLDCIRPPQSIALSLVDKATETSVQTFVALPS